MARKCPRCRSLDVRRSAIHVNDGSARHIFFSPYRCRKCRVRFWTISKDTYYLAGIVAVVFLAGSASWTVWMMAERKFSDAQQASAGRQYSGIAKLAEQGDPDAEYKLGQMHVYGDGVPKSDKEAAKWFARAAQHGNITALYEFGMALREGRGVVQDYESAVKWLRLAAERGNANAEYQLGLLYRDGLGVPIDKVKAYTWLNLAVADGLTEAAPARDGVLRLLVPDEVLQGQAEARRLGEDLHRAKRAR